MVEKPIFVVPFLPNINLPEEDGMGIERRIRREGDHDHSENQEESASRKLVVVVVAYPYLAMADDLCPLEADDRFDVQWRRERIPRPYPHTSAVILPGSRWTRRDLKWIHDSGWGRFLLLHMSKGGAILGLCAGYQMLGRTVDDPLNVEGKDGSRKGLAFLPVETTMAKAECKIVTPMKIRSMNASRGQAFILTVV